MGEKHKTHASFRKQKKNRTKRNKKKKGLLVDLAIK